MFLPFAFQKPSIAGRLGFPKRSIAAPLGIGFLVRAARRLSASGL
jgi:hypothetical protein